MKEVSFKNDILPLKDIIFRLALRITLNREDAEDIVQETLIRLWNETKKGEVRDPKAMAMTVCRNLSLDLVEKRERKNFSLDEQVHDRPDVAVSPDRAVENMEKWQIINSMINQLPEKQRTAVQLRDVEGRTYKEIADVMQISEADVKVNIFRARQKLREQLTGIKQ